MAPQTTTKRKVTGVEHSCFAKKAFLLFLTILCLSSPASPIATAHLTAHPPRLEKSGQTVTFSWSGLYKPSPLDWIGVYSPPDSPNNEFIGWYNLTSCSTWQLGRGQLSFPLTKLRSSYQFRLFAAPHNAPPLGLNEVPVPSAQPLGVADVSFDQWNEPQHVHLALTGQADEMRVMFSTRDSISCTVRYGLAADALESESPAERATYTQANMCEAPANTTLGWRDPGWIHNAVLTGLKSNTRYYYKVGSNEGGWSEVFSFFTQSSEAGPEETHAFVFGDMGVGASYLSYLRLQPESTLTVQHMLRDLAQLGNKPAFVSHIGDLSYARGYAWLWDEFLALIEPLAAQVPYHVGIGNHEYNWPGQPWNPTWANYGHDGGGECGVPYSRLFHMPGNSSVETGTGAPATRNLWYSVDVGLVHFVTFSTEHNFLKGSEQYQWLEHDLATVDRAVTPYVVVQGHRPLYTSNNELRDQNKRQHMQQDLEPLFLRYGVTLGLWGHVHKYERTCHLANYTCFEPGSTSPGSKLLPPVHAVIGMAGQDWQPQWEPLNGVWPVYPQPEWSVFRTEGFGYCRLHATRESLTLSYIANHDGEVHDQVVIANPFGAVPKQQQQMQSVEPRRHWNLALLLSLFAATVVVNVGTVVTVWLLLRKLAKGVQEHEWEEVGTKEIP